MARGLPRAPIFYLKIVLHFFRSVKSVIYAIRLMPVEVKRRLTLFGIQLTNEDVWIL